MNRVVFLVSSLMLVACSGPMGKQGPIGPTGLPGEDGAVGPQGPGFDAPASISGVVPRFVVPGQTADITISGFATKWTPQSAPNFGAGIKINSSRLGSGTSLVVNITVEADAVPGPRDVLVRESGTSTSFKAFEVKAYATLSISGAQKQGGIVLAHLEVNDPMFAFADNTTLSAPGVAVALTAVKTLTRTRDILLGIQPNAPLMPHALTLTSGALTYTFPDALLPEVNTPAPLPDLPGILTFTEPGESQVFAVPMQPRGSAFAINNGAIIAYTPTSGWGPNTSFGTNVAVAGAGLLVIYDAAKMEPAATLSKVSAPVLTDIEPNETSATAQVLPGIPATINGTFTGSTDKDYFSFVVPQSAVGKHFFIDAISAASEDFWVTVKVGNVVVIPRKNLYGSTTVSALSAGVLPAGTLELLVEPYGSTKLDYNIWIEFQ